MSTSLFRSRGKDFAFVHMERRLDHLRVGPQRSRLAGHAVVVRERHILGTPEEIVDDKLSRRARLRRHADAVDDEIDTDSIYVLDRHTLDALSERVPHL